MLFPWWLAIGFFFQSLGKVHGFVGGSFDKLNTWKEKLTFDEYLIELADLQASGAEGKFKYLEASVCIISKYF